MKRLSIIIVAVLAVLLVACSSQKDPKSAVRTYFNAIENEEFYEAACVCLQDGNFNADAKAQELRGRYGKILKHFRILGVEQISETEAVAAVKYKTAFSEATGDEMELVHLTKVGDVWFVGKKAQPFNFEDMDWSGMDEDAIADALGEDTDLNMEEAEEAAVAMAEEAADEE